MGVAPPNPTADFVQREAEASKHPEEFDDLMKFVSRQTFLMNPVGGIITQKFKFQEPDDFRALHRLISASATSMHSCPEVSRSFWPCLQKSERSNKEGEEDMAVSLQNVRKSGLGSDIARRCSSGAGAMPKLKMCVLNTNALTAVAC